MGTILNAAIVRDAATLIVVDRREDRIRILMGRRSDTARFMPGHHVFPGGAVDPADFTAPVARSLSALTQAHVCRAADPELAVALGIAAARELHEETGLSLGQPPSLGGLRYLCRAVTPEDWPIRFNARFFVVGREHLVGDTPDGRFVADNELLDVKWHGLDDMNDLRLARPTRWALSLLSQRILNSSWPDQQDASLPLLLANDGFGTCE